jgi:hypothetical protein
VFLPAHSLSGLQGLFAALARLSQF